MPCLTPGHSLIRQYPIPGCAGRRRRRRRRRSREEEEGGGGDVDAWEQERGKGGSCCDWPVQEYDVQSLQSQQRGLGHHNTSRPGGATSQVGQPRPGSRPNAAHTNKQTQTYTLRWCRSSHGARGTQEGAAVSRGQHTALRHHRSPPGPQRVCGQRTRASSAAASRS